MSRTSKALKLLRDNPGMTQTDAAKLAGVSQAVISRALSDKKRTAAFRCKHCGSSLRYLKEIVGK